MKYTARHYFAYSVLCVTLLAHCVLLGLQNFDIAPVWLSELSRFIPFYWILPALILAVACAFILSPVWPVLAVGNLILFAWITMDFHWRLTEPLMEKGVRLRVLTYNIKALAAERRQGGIDRINQEVQSYAPDIVALQDAQKWLVIGDEQGPASVRPIFGLPYVYGVDQFVLASRYPLEGCTAGKLEPNTTAVQFLQCTAKLGSQEVMLVTTHLVSPRHSLVATKTELWDGLEQWQSNIAERLYQSTTLLSLLAKHRTPVLLMGDFNAPEQSPVIANLQLLGLKDAFAQAGRGWGFTHGHALSRGLDVFRIDHVLVSPSIRVARAFVGTGSASEHNAVVADLLLPV